VTNSTHVTHLQTKLDMLEEKLASSKAQEALLNGSEKNVSELAAQYQRNVDILHAFLTSNSYLNLADVRPATVCTVAGTCSQEPACARLAIKPSVVKTSDMS
jgi:hypothetical protein